MQQTFSINLNTVANSCTNKYSFLQEDKQPWSISDYWKSTQLTELVYAELNELNIPELTVSIARFTGPTACMDRETNCNCCADSSMSR